MIVDLQAMVRRDAGGRRLELDLLGDI